MTRSRSPAAEALPPLVAGVLESAETAEEKLRTAAETRRRAFRDTLRDVTTAAEAASVDDAEPTAEAVAAYATHVADAVIKPLIDVLTAEADAQRLVAVWETLRSDLVAKAARLPLTHTRPEPPDLYRGVATDGILRRLGKGLVRSGRTLTLPFSALGTLISGSPRRDRTQVIHLRALGSFHLDVRMRRLLATELDGVLAELGGPVAGLESAISDWVNGVLELGARLWSREGADSPHPDEPDESDESDEPAPGEALVEYHRALMERLARALETVEGLPDRPEAVAARGQVLFESEIERSGTFMLPMGPRSFEAIHRVTVTIDARWVDFYRRASRRFELGVDVLTLWRGLSTELGAFERAIRTIMAPAGAALRKAGAAFSALMETDPSEDLTGARIDHVEGKTAEALVHVRRGLSDHRIGVLVGEAADEVAQALANATRSLPTVYRCQELHEPGEAISPSPPRRDFRLREVAEASFDVLTLERVRAVSEPIVAHYEAASHALVEVDSILDFNLSAAREELQSDPPHPSVARELVDGALERSGDLLGETANRMDAGVDAEFPTARAALYRAWERLHARVRVEEQRQDELLGLWTAIRRGAAVRVARFRERLDAWEKASWALVARWQKRFAGLLRRGEAVLQSQVSEADVERTLRAITDVEKLIESLPIVYRRLFSLSPITDPDMVVGRESEIGRVRHLRRRWEGGVAPILAVTAAEGKGKTTFLNVLERVVFQDSRCIRVTLDHRISAAEEFFTAVHARALGTAPDSTEASETSRPGTAVEATARATFDALVTDGGGTPTVVMVEPAEHLFSRRVGGANMMEQILTQLRQSPAHVWWILTSSPYSWTMVERLEPAASSLATRLDLQPLDRAEIESVVIDRHQRSGLPVEFIPPPDPPRRLVSEVKKAQGPEAVQAIYRREFFDDLESTCMGDLTLALFYWLRSVELDRGNRVLKVHPLRPLGFDFLASLKLDQAFALKSFLDHLSLTPQEYADISGTQVNGAVLLFESLYGFRLIQPEGRGEADKVLPVQATERYRIHPLTQTAIVDALAGRRIVH